MQRGLSQGVVVSECQKIGALVPEFHRSFNRLYGSWRYPILFVAGSKATFTSGSGRRALSAVIRS
jgi:hypothetical protein